MSFQEVKTNLVNQAKIFHFGAVSLTAEPARGACLQTARYARKNGITVSFDPNWRPLLWESRDLAKKWITEGIRLATVLKVSREEMALVTNESDPEKGGDQLLKEGPSLVFVTLGDAGCYFLSKNARGYVPSFAVDVADTTGAGDAFTAGILYKLTSGGKCMDRVSHNELYSIAKFANAVGALCTKIRGAIPAMPYKAQVNDILHMNCLK